MSCLEHECHVCGAVWFDNTSEPCPKCGSENFDTRFDEDPEPLNETTEEEE